MKIGYKNLKILAVLYALVPIVIFYVGWLNIPSAIIFTLLAALAFFFFLRNASHRDGKAKSITISKKQIIVIAVIAFVWCFMAGQGGFVHQSADHVARNMTFKDLISEKWPVTYDDGKTMMCYYIGHWMVPAVFGKIALFVSHNTRAAYIVGNIALLLWSSLGCFIVLMLLVMITNTGKKPRIFIAIFMFIFFSGLDIVGVLLTKKINLLNGQIHIEWWNQIWMQFSSVTTCLYWVYNQCIVPWIVMLCIINETRLKNLAMLAILAFPFGPFPFVGIVLFCILRAISALCKAIKTKSFAAFFKDVFSLQNIFAMLAIAPVYLLYYSANAVISSGKTAAGNVSASGSGAAASGSAVSAKSSAAAANKSGTNTGFRIYDKYVQAYQSHDTAKLLYYAKWYAIFMVLEIGLYAAIILIRKKPDIVFIGTLIELFIIPIFYIGDNADICMRVSIPGLIYLCVTFIQVIMRELPEWGEYGSFNNCMRHKKFLIVALAVFLIGTVTPATEIKREFLATVTTPYSEIMKHFDESSSVKGSNFVARNYKNSYFYKYLCQKPDEKK